MQNIIGQKGDLGITKTCRGISLSAEAAKVNYLLLLNQIWTEIEKFFWKIRTALPAYRFLPSVELSIEYEPKILSQHYGS